MKRLARRDRAPRPGIVHLGPGAFFRAFNAIFTQDALEKAGGDWGIIAVSLKSTTARNQLAPQGCVYTSLTLGAAGREARVIGSIVDVRVATEDPNAIVELMADPSIKIVSLTITEKGYGYDPASKGLDLTNPDIAADLTQENPPLSAVGFITAALKQRRNAGTAPFTVLSCDNLPSNGKVARQVVLDFAEHLDPSLAEWIASDVPFPSTMVDRITPATTEADVSRLAEDEGYEDPACVVHEAFRQWVIEDTFATGRPAWHLAGAQLVSDVGPYEVMKLRCLNGTHSALAYLGYLAGFETVSEAVADAEFCALLEKLWHAEIIPVVPPPDSEDLARYCDHLMSRFRDTAIHHRLWQIAMDGSQKLPQRILATIADHAAEGRMPSGLCLVVAAWIRYVSGIDEAGEPIDVSDPLASRLSDATCREILEMQDVFPRELSEDPAFVQTVSSWYTVLSNSGVRIAVREYLQQRL